jgi:predicted  nucleic acid-binding Zn-ribbon protein
LREEIGRLMALQMIDKELQELAESLAAVTQGVDRLREETNSARAELERLTQEDKQAEVARRELERELSEGEARIRDKRMRQNLIRNDKELQALAHEVESQKETNQRQEAEVLAQMEVAEARAVRIKELTAQVQQKSVELTAAEKEIAGKAEELKEAMRQGRIAREALAPQIDPTLRQRYEVIFNRRGGLAVALARSGTCQGCRMRLPPQLYNQIQRSEQIYYCPNCQRILYFDPVPSPES